MELIAAPCGGAGEAEAVLGTPGDQRHCWCQFDRWSMPAYRGMSDDEKRGHLFAQVASGGASPGVIAMLGDEPVGWASVAPRATFPRIGSSTSMSTVDTRADLDDAGIWSVTCFVVRTRYRRHGVSAVLLDAAVDHARASGAHTVEGYPVDAAERPRAGSGTYRGRLSTFLAAGFTVVARPRAGWAVVRVTL
ncbi:GNAT family N-acetyltransferase [Cellulomonas sp. McL0617]|uniref:GNAT family N-acetyltransferase n=1 Tax=Cellulomonas sp. McL0617 TaxID=3415675 RepID=UPI003CF7B36E